MKCFLTMFSMSSNFAKNDDQNNFQTLFFHSVLIFLIKFTDTATLSLARNVWNCGQLCFKQFLEKKTCKTVWLFVSILSLKEKVAEDRGRGLSLYLNLNSLPKKVCKSDRYKKQAIFKEPNPT